MRTLAAVKSGIDGVMLSIAALRMDASPKGKCGGLKSGSAT
jgi:hypothetical protein